jgi:hypothetical protein
MKINKLTAALIAMGVVSVASTYAANPTVYLTGSTAARATLFAAIQAGDVFDGGSAGTLPNGGSGSSSALVFEGPINSVTVDIVASYTGSEAGIADVAGTTVTQTIGGTTYNLPGVPTAFLQPPYSSSNTTTAQETPSLTLADTSQAVSLTKKSVYNLTDFGIVGIVPFTFMKGYEATPDSTWSNVVNVTSSEAYTTLAGPTPANYWTGVAADSAEPVVIVGRNKGSGTRVNTFLNVGYSLSASVDQYGYGYYPSATPGVLTFTGSYAAGQSLFEFGNDGFDSGSSVQKSLNVDGTGQGAVEVGYVGISDGANAYTHSSGGGSATYLPFNGVYEGDNGVINGNYTFWGQEHLLGSAGLQNTSTAYQVGHALAAGLAKYAAANLGAASGVVPAAQSALVPVTAMQVLRSTDSGVPVIGVFPAQSYTP